MLSKILKFLINKPKVVHLFLLFVFILGGINLYTINRTGYPNVDFGIVNITTVYPGASAQDVELKVTRKIEKELNALENVKRVVSSSIENLSQISIYLEEDIDYEKAESDAQKLVDGVPDLPKDLKSKPLVKKVDNDRIPVLEIGITSPKNNEEDIFNAIQDIEDRLLQIKEVASVRNAGYLKKEIHIVADPEKLTAFQVTLSDLVTAIQGQNLRQPGGDLKSIEEKKIVIRSDFQTLSDIENVVIRSGFNNKVLLKDVAQITKSMEPAETYVSFNGKRCVQISIIKSAEGDILDVVDKVKNKINEIRPVFPDVEIELITDYAVEVVSLLTLVKKNAALGLALVLIFLILLLEWQVAFWTAMGIPISILMAFVVLPFFGASINFISLLGLILILGMVVDDAIVVSENIYKYREDGLDPETASIKGTHEVMYPVIATILTTVMAFTPLMFMTGILGNFMVQMPLVVCFILCASLFESLFILPVHMAHSKVTKIASKRKNIMAYVEKMYRKGANITIKHHVKTVMVFCVIFGVSLIILTQKMQFVLFQNSDGLYGAIEFETDAGTSLDLTQEKANEIHKRLETLSPKEIEGYVTVIGEEKAEITTFGLKNNHSAVGNILVFLTPYKSRERNAQEIMDTVSETLAPLQGFKSLDAYAINDGPPIGRAITVTLIGNDKLQRNGLKEKLIVFLKNQEGVTNIETSEGTGKNRLEVKIDYEKSGQLGLAIPNIINVFQTFYKGTIASQVEWENRDINIRVSVPDTYKKSFEALDQVMVRNNRGKYVAIENVVSVSEKKDVLNISHYDNQDAVIVYGDIEDEKTTSYQVNKKIKEFVAAYKEQYPLITTEFGGEERDTEEAMKSLGIAMAIALIGIFSILVILFNSFSQPLVVMSAIPFTLPGIIFAFYTHNIVFGFTAIIGLIGLTGIVVNNALIMISFINQSVKQKGFSAAAIAEGATRRLRPILLTSITTAAGLFPSAYQFGGDNAFIVPMIMAVVWGLIFASFVTLYLIPALYAIHYKLINKIRLSQETVQHGASI